MSDNEAKRGQKMCEAGLILTIPAGSWSTAAVAPPCLENKKAERERRAAKCFLGKKWKMDTRAAHFRGVQL